MKSLVLDTTYDSNNENDLLDNDGQFDLDANTGVQAADPNHKVAFQRGISAGEVKKAEAQGSETLRIEPAQDEQSSMTQEVDGNMSGQGPGSGPANARPDEPACGPINKT